MKKILFVLLMAGVFVGLMTVSAIAETAYLPDRTVVSATINADNTEATITISGVEPVMVEHYSRLEGIVPLGSVTTFVVKRKETGRFNFTFGKGTYVYLDRQMVADPPSFIGPGIKVDTSEPGACFDVDWGGAWK